MNADRNLLLGILALQMDFIGRDALVAAMHAWVLDKARPLGQILLAQGAIREDEHALLEAMVEKHVERHGNDLEKSLAAVTPVGPVHDELQRLADPDVEASLAHVAAPSPADDAYATQTLSAGARSSSGTRFTILRPHAKGGLGQVSVALDEELDREVAFKEIQDRHADNPDSRGRFLLEAKVTGGLEHPGIVPVYGLGSYANGRPFYAMRFVRGDSLKDAIKRFHQVDSAGRDPTERTVELRKLLGRFIDVCDAIEYAHSRGVLHRDLKPGNVMLGKYGETLVVDWGLAKVVGRAEASDEGGEQALKPASASGSAATQMGATVGTPQYMSPEQASGRLDELGPASDVYSLGATLYTLLTGRAPFLDEGESKAVLTRVEQGEFPPPRSVKPGVPKPLEAVCLKAMALKPTDRYAAPRTLAEDLEHWLADEPIAADPENRVRRWGRWLRRHRAWTRAAAAALVVVSVVSVVALAVVNAARRDAQRQRDVARDARAAEAEQVVKTKAALQAETKAKQKARQAIDHYVEAVQEAELLTDERFQPLRKRLLKDALGFYQEFIREHERDAGAQADLADALFQVGRINAKTGSATEAIEACTSAVAVYRQLVEQDPTVDQHQDNLSGSYNNLGNLQATVGMREAALRNFQQALAIRRKLAAAHPAALRHQRQLADTLNDMAAWHAVARKHAAALSYYREALAIRQRLAADNPAVAQRQSDLAASYGNLGALEVGTRDYDAAQASYSEALAIRRKLAADDTGSGGFQSDLATTLYNLALLQIEIKQFDAALASHQEALAIRRKLAQENPTVIEFRIDLAASCHDLGALKYGQDDHAGAHDCWTEALTIRRKLVVEEPDIAAYQSDLAATCNNLGALEASAGELDEARASFGEAVAIQRKLADGNPTIVQYRVDLGGMCLNLGLFDQQRGQVADAVDWYAQAVDALSAVVEREPSFAEAGSRLGRAPVSCPGPANLGPPCRCRRRLAKGDRAGRRQRSPGPSLDVGRRLGARAGDHVNAEAEVGELAQTANLSGGDLYNLACVLAVSVSTAGTDDAQRVERLAQSAVELLKRSQAAGFFVESARLDHLRQDKDLDSLRDRDDFRQFVDELPAAR